MNTLLIRFAIRHAGVVVVLAILILIFGIYRVGSIPLDVFPEFSPNQVPEPGGLLLTGLAIGLLGLRRRPPYRSLPKR